MQTPRHPFKLCSHQDTHWELHGRELVQQALSTQCQPALGCCLSGWGQTSSWPYGLSLDLSPSFWDALLSFLMPLSLNWYPFPFLWDEHLSPCHVSWRSWSAFPGHNRRWVAWDPLDAAWAPGSAASGLLLSLTGLALPLRAPRSAWFFHGLAGTAGRVGCQALLSSLALARRWVGRSRLPLPELLGTWA